jgi:hypothetical protein
MQIRPFSEINAYFRQKLTDPAVCLSSDRKFSFLKILQHALSYSLIEDQSKIIRNYIHLPWRVHAAMLDMKSLIRPVKKKKTIRATYAIIDPGRMLLDESEVPHSVYFEKVKGCLVDHKCFTFLKKKTQGIVADDCLENHPHQYPLLNADERKMLHRVHSIAENTKRSGIFTTVELNYIKSSLHIFFDDFRFYYQLFRNSEIQKVYFICHYHNEGLIAALKLLKIKAVELQHGLISGNDLYYVYDAAFGDVIQNAFFPDKILVYGSYWKKILQRGSEFALHQIEIAGDYLFRKSSSQVTSAEKENLILICAQKGMHEDYVKYCLHLAGQLKCHPEWKIAVKLHPLETKREAYDVLTEHGVSIASPTSSLDEFLAKAKIQISIYSTTFYDAVGFDVLNLSIQQYGTSSDYAADIIREGIANPIGFDQDPVMVYHDNCGKSAIQSIQRNEIYAGFNCNAVRQA